VLAARGARTWRRTAAAVRGVTCSSGCGATHAGSQS
jgi:hypothetical protein